MMRSETSSERGSGSPDYSPKSPLKSRFKRLLKRLSSSKKEEKPADFSSIETNLTTECCGGVGVGELKRVFRYFDENGDGKISASELQTCVRNSGGEISSQEAEAAVGSTDSDGDGYITPKSLKRMLNKLGESKKTVEDCKLMIRMFDLNGDGVLSFDEFTAMMQ